MKYPELIIRNNDEEEFIHLSGGFYRTNRGLKKWKCK